VTYPDRATFEEARTRRAPPRKAAAIKAGKDRGTDAHEEHAAKTHAAINALKFSDLRIVNVSRCLRWHPVKSIPWTCADWSNALCGEAGELANVIKKIRRHDTGAVNEGDPPRDQLVKAAADELADVVIYADLLAHHFGIDLGAAIKSKFNRTSEKFGFPERIGI
jgi:NTP pyrophosphatase (non-canonical NTP hydrolase)